MPRSVLIADDTVFVRRLVRDVLRREGFVVHEAVSGRDALIAYEERRPDLAILDLGLGDMDATDVVDALRQLDASVRVVVLGAESADRVAPQIARCEACGYLEKPFQPAQLLEAVRAALRP